MASPGYKSGWQQGMATAGFMRHNLMLFWQQISAFSVTRRDVLNRADKDECLLEVHLLEQIAGLADGSGIPYRDLLAFNLYGASTSPDGCTVMVALPDATRDGRTLILKNSDQVGRERRVGPNFDQTKEIYVIQVVRAPNGVNIVGLSAAGSTGIKVGVNDKGVAAGSNIARTVELASRGIDITKVRASDRTQLLREGLEEDTALAASQRIASKVAASPTSTPGNMEFADARECWFLETSYAHVASEVIRDGVASRANRFQILENLNSKEDVSSLCRYARTQHLLRERAPGLTFEDFMRFSADHENGPGPNSICRHGRDIHDETSLGAAVIEINPERPAASRIAIALGKPCHAWRSREGWVELTADVTGDAVASPFVHGTTWKRFYSEIPNDGRMSVGV